MCFIIIILVLRRHYRSHYSVIRSMSLTHRWNKGIESLTCVSFRAQNLRRHWVDTVNTCPPAMKNMRLSFIPQLCLMFMLSRSIRDRISCSGRQGWDSEDLEDGRKYAATGVGGGWLRDYIGIHRALGCGRLSGVKSIFWFAPFGLVPWELNNSKLAVMRTEFVFSLPKAITKLKPLSKAMQNNKDDRSILISF